MGNGTSSPAASPTSSPGKKKFSGPSSMSGPPVRPRDVLSQRPNYKHKSRREAKLEEDERIARENAIAARALARARATVAARRQREAEAAAAAAAQAEAEAKANAQLEAACAEKGDGAAHEQAALPDGPDNEADAETDAPGGWLQHLPRTSNLAALHQRTGGGAETKETDAPADESAAPHHTRSIQHVATFHEILSAAQSRAENIASRSSSPADDMTSEDQAQHHHHHHNHHHHPHHHHKKHAKHHKRKKMKRTATEKVIVDASKRHLDASPARPFNAVSASQRRDEENAKASKNGSQDVVEKLWTCAVCSTENKRTFVRCGTCQSGRDVTVASDLLRRVKKARKVVAHHLKQARDKRKKGDEAGSLASTDDAKDVAKRWLLTAFATSIEVIAHKFVCDGSPESALVLVKEHVRICETYWKFRTVWLGAVNIGFTLAVVLGDTAAAAQFSKQLHNAFCKFGQQAAIATTSWQRKYGGKRGAGSEDAVPPPPPASQVREILDTVRSLPAPKLQKANPGQPKATSSADFFADKFGVAPAESKANEKPSLSNGEVPEFIHFKDVTEQEVSEILLQLVVYCMNFQALHHASHSRCATPDSRSEGNSKTDTSPSTVIPPCSVERLDQIMEDIFVSAGILLEDEEKWQSRRSARDPTSKDYCPPVDLSARTVDMLPCIRRRLLVLNEVYLSRGNIQFNLQTRTIIPSPTASKARDSNPVFPTENVDSSDVAEYTQSFLDSAAPLSYQLFSGVCEGLAPERLAARLDPLLHAAVTLRALATVEVLNAGGFDPNERDGEGYSALHCACVLSTQAEHLAKTLLDGQADPNAQDNEYCTPLHYAASVPGNGALVALLLLHGADPSLQDSEGVTPAEYATATGDQEMILLLINSRKRVHVQRRASWSLGVGASDDHILTEERNWRSAPSSADTSTNGSEWVQCWDENTGYAFFQNTRTGESQWIESDDWAQEEAVWREDMRESADGAAAASSESPAAEGATPETHRRRTDNTVTDFRSAMQVCLANATCLLVVVAC